MFASNLMLLQRRTQLQSTQVESDVTVLPLVLTARDFIIIHLWVKVNSGKFEDIASKVIHELSHEQNGVNGGQPLNITPMLIKKPNTNRGWGRTSSTRKRSLCVSFMACCSISFMPPAFLFLSHKDWASPIILSCKHTQHMWTHSMNSCMINHLSLTNIY